MNLRRLAYERPKVKQDRQTIWTMKDETDILICEMSNSHIINCIQMLTKKIIQYERHKIDFFDDNSETYAIYHYKQEQCEHWIKLFEHELRYREQENIRI